MTSLYSITCWALPTSTTAAKNVIINYAGSASINTWGQGLIQGTDVNYWIVEGFKIQSNTESVVVTYNGTSYTRTLPKIWAGILLVNADHVTVRYNHTFNTGISGIIFRPKTIAGSCTDLDLACAIQNTGDKVIGNRIEKPNQGWKDNTGAFIWEQEALTMWGVNGSFEVASNRVIDGTKEGIDIKLGRDGIVHSNIVDGVSKGIPEMGIGLQGPGIYLDGRKEQMYNIKVYRNIVKNNLAGITVLTERPLSTDNSIYNIKIYNNLVHGNSSTGLSVGDRVGNPNGTFDVEIYHNTFAQNNKSFMLKTWWDPTLKPGLGTANVPPKNVMIRNNIFANNTGGQSNIISASNITVDDNIATWVSYQVVANVATGLSNIVLTDNIINSSMQVTTANPNPIQFVSLSGGTYFLGLQSTSPAINVGDTNTGPALTDFDGISRTAFGLPDMGAYEFH